MTALSTDTLQAPGTPPSNDVLSAMAEAAVLARLSLRSWERMAQDGHNPPRVQLGARHVAYWRGGAGLAARPDLPR